MNLFKHHENVTAVQLSDILCSKKKMFRPMRSEMCCINERNRRTLMNSFDELPLKWHHATNKNAACKTTATFPKQNKNIIVMKY